MTVIKRSTRSNDFRSEMVRLTGIEKWKEGRWWREFLDERRGFFSKTEISAKPKETERVALEGLFKDWVKTSDEWWAGDWVEKAGLADWHVSQHLRARKLSEPDPALSNQPMENESGTGVQQFDPVRDV